MAESRWKLDPDSETILELDDQGGTTRWSAPVTIHGSFVNGAGERLDFRNKYWRTLSVTEFSEPLSRDELVDEGRQELSRGGGDG